MPTMTLTNHQVVDLVKQLPPEEKRAALFLLAEGATRQREVRMSHAESQLRYSAKQRGLNWDMMSDEDREIFVDDLLHEG